MIPTSVLTPAPAPIPPPLPPQSVENDAARVRKEWSKFIDTWYEPRQKKLIERLQRDLLVKYENLGSAKETQKLREIELFEKLDSIAQQLAQPARAEWERRLELAQLCEAQWDDMSREDQQAVLSVFLGFFADDVSALSMNHLATLYPSNAGYSAEPVLFRPQNGHKERSSSRVSQAPAVDDSPQPLPVMGHAKGLQPLDPIIPRNPRHIGSEAPGSTTLGQLTPSPWSTDIIRSSFPHDLTGYVLQKGKYPFASGGCGDVYRGTFRMRGRQIDVAIKTIRTYASEDADSSKKMKRLRREMRVWLNLNHTNVLPLFGTTMNFGRFPAMVCPWAENGALTSYLERLHNTLTRLQRFALLNGVACGLHYLHSRHIVHGDLSGANVLIHEDGRACIADFGLSTLLTELGASTFATSHHAKGSLRWMAPELIIVSEDDSEDTSPKVTPKVQSDVYSFGGVMLQILTGNVPYHYYVRDAQVMNALAKGITPRRPSESLVTEYQWSFIKRCWSPADATESRPSSNEIVKLTRKELSVYVG